VVDVQEVTDVHSHTVYLPERRSGKDRRIREKGSQVKIKVITD